MEFDPAWHGKPPGDKKELNAALRDLRTLQGKLDSDLD